MDARKVQIKLYAEQGKERSLDSYIAIFHRWVKDALVDEMVFDVADYTHVPRGTGVLLVGHAADYCIDQGEGRPGLVYCRKRDLPEGAPLVEDALRRVLKAAKLLNEDSEVKGPSAFSSTEILFRFPERLYLKNDDVSFEKAQPALNSALKALLPGTAYLLTREGDSREPLTIRARS